MPRTLLKKLLPLTLAMVLAAGAAEAAKTKRKSAPAPEDALETSATVAVNDPLERFNRNVFSFNQGFDQYLLRPVAKGYRYVTPTPVRNSLGHVTDNLFEPVSMFNAFLQGDFTQGMTSFWRIILNTTIGIGGINDVASEFGLQPRNEDFGQTLATWGVGSGPYIVLPILGPSNLRDTVGYVGDVYTNPVYYYLDFNDAFYLTAARTVVVRERLLDPIDDINQSSLDPYVSFRSIYTQRRAAQISNRSSDASLLDGTN